MTDLGIDIAWLPVSAPVRPNVAALSLKHFWKRDFVNHPFIFHAYAVGATELVLATLNYEDSSTANLLRRIQRKQYHLALHHMAIEINRPDFRPSQAHVHAASALARHTKPIQDSREREFVPADPYPQSPLASFQNLDMLGHLDLALSHVEAMYDMVKMRGGIETIKPPVLDLLEVYAPLSKE